MSEVLSELLASSKVHLAAAVDEVKLVAAVRLLTARAHASVAIFGCITM